MSNAQHVLAQAMGRPAPAALPTTLAPPVDEALHWAMLARNGLTLASALLALLIAYVFLQAVRRYRGPRLQPVPLDYKQQRRRLHVAAAAAAQTGNK